jgi:hypothetical protein
MNPLTLRAELLAIAGALDALPRGEAEADGDVAPGNVEMSDTLAKELSARLRALADPEHSHAAGCPALDVHAPAACTCR